MAPLGRRLRLPDKEHAASADVHGRDMVRLAMASALATLEFVPRRAALLGCVSAASRTRLRGVRRVDVNHSNSGQSCFVFYKLAELGETPAESSRAIAFSNRGRCVDAREVFEGDGASRVFRVLYDLLGDIVIFVPAEPRLLTCSMSN